MYYLCFMVVIRLFLSKRGCEGVGKGKIGGSG